MLGGQLTSQMARKRPGSGRLATCGVGRVSAWNTGDAEYSRAPSLCAPRTAKARVKGYPALQVSLALTLTTSTVASWLLPGRFLATSWPLVRLTAAHPKLK